MDWQALVHGVSESDMHEDWAHTYLKFAYLGRSPVATD